MFHRQSTNTSSSPTCSIQRHRGRLGCETLLLRIYPWASLKAEGQFWQVTFIKSRKAFRKSDTNWELLKVGNKVLDAEAAGEKRYLAVERIAKELNKSERYVWKALALLENPTKLLDSED
jgi:hypothetical protein